MSNKNCTIHYQTLMHGCTRRAVTDKITLDICEHHSYGHQKRTPPPEKKMNNDRFNLIFPPNGSISSSIFLSLYFHDCQIQRIDTMRHNKIICIFFSIFVKLTNYFVHVKRMAKDVL